MTISTEIKIAILASILAFGIMVCAQTAGKEKSNNELANQLYFEQSIK